MREKLFSAAEIQNLIDQLVKEILSDQKDLSNLALIGIRTGGVYLAKQLQKRFESLCGQKIPMGILDINLYRDDFDLGDRQPDVRQSSIGFSIQGKTILLVDDVLYTGRTVRAALEAMNDYGRPAAVRLVVLVDRGHRELPIEANYTGARVETTRQERIKVSFNDSGEPDQVERIQLPQS